jgi:hypothetical protein
LSEEELRKKIADDIEAKLRPLCGKDKHEGGYDCCGCATYDMIVTDAVQVALGGEPDGYKWR